MVNADSRIQEVREVDRIMKVDKNMIDKKEISKNIKKSRVVQTVMIDMIINVVKTVEIIMNLANLTNLVNLSSSKKKF